ncbi:NAD-dependent epimerase/dehydratase family protein [Cyanobium sp. NIES-981]|uniref:NAD-dependent epimerase/dehydratase family protein n=1 Tax=Cyanobium sp. NIES-981 TaxID=1851505 RepID=UPI0012FBDD97|nr:NAD-dependent epimerase/dehydratase family protein [Cyanobium sp. NIES-981]
MGDTGFLGSNLIHHFISFYPLWQCTGISRRSSGLLLNPNGSYQHVCLDANTPSSLEQWMQWADVVVDFAHSRKPLTNNDDKDSGLDYEYFQALETRLRLAEKSSVHLYLYSSSGGAVYGNKYDDGIAKLSAEESALKPISIYGLEKCIAEQIVAFTLRESSTNYVLMRISNPYGSLVPAHRRHGFIPRLLRSILADDTVEIWGDPDSIQKDFIFMEDVCACIAKILSYHGHEHVFNIGSATSISLTNVIRIAEEKCGRRAKLRLSEGKPGDVTKFCLDISRAAKELGWSPSTPLEDGMGKTLAALSMEQS